MCRSAVWLADEVRDRERDAELERALVDAAPEDLLGLFDPVADRVLVDAEPFGGSAAAGVLLEVGAQSSREPVQSDRRRRPGRGARADECVGLVEVSSCDRGKRDARRSG